MKRTTILLLTLFIFSSLRAEQPAYPPASGGWEQIFGDEFEADKLDRILWQYEHGTYNSAGDSRRDSANIAVAGGDLRIYMRRTDDAANQKLRWTCGYIYTREKFGRNVYFEARMKSPFISGVNSAFWLVTRDVLPTSFNNRYEIDINEIQYDVERKQQGAHLAWHDWKTYQYATDASGNQVDNALGAMEYFDSDDYQIWGLWIDGNDQFHYYLNGREIWDGKTHKEHKRQWDTGIGKISPWATLEEQRAYGKYAQKDWNYRGGYTGELMQIAFSNMMMPSALTPETDDADGSYMSVDWVRVYVPASERSVEPLSDLSEIQPEGEVTWNADTMILGSTTVRLPLPEPISLAVADRRYLAYTVATDTAFDYTVRGISDTGEEIVSFSSRGVSDHTLRFGDRTTSSLAVYPYAFYHDRTLDTPEQFHVHRLTPILNADQCDTWSVAIFNRHEQIPEVEPFFYPNIDESGQTSINNQWALNARNISHAAIVAFEVTNRSSEPLKISDWRIGDCFRSVTAGKSSEPYACTDEVKLKTGNDTLSVRIEGDAREYALTYTANGVLKSCTGLSAGWNRIPVSPEATTEYVLQSVTGDGRTGRVSGRTQIIVPASGDDKLYPAYDTYIQENNPTADFSESQSLVLKTDRQYIREGYMEYDISRYTDPVRSATLFLYLSTAELGALPATVAVSNIEPSDVRPYLWKDRSHWVKENESGRFVVSRAVPGYYGVEVTEALNRAIMRGDKTCAFKLAVVDGDRNALLTFQQYRNNRLDCSPHLVVTPDSQTLLGEEHTAELIFDTFVAQQGVGSTPGSANGENYLWLKNRNSSWGRDAYLSFALPESVQPGTAALKLRLFSMQDADRYVFVRLEGRQEAAIDRLSWDDVPDGFSEIGWIAVDTTDVGKQLSWDVSDFVAQQRSSGNTRLTFRLSVVCGSVNAFLKFDQGHGNATPSDMPPTLVCRSIDRTSQTLLPTLRQQGKMLIANPVSDSFVLTDPADVESLYLFSLDGACRAYWQGGAACYSIGHLPASVYLLVVNRSDGSRVVERLVKQ